MSANSVRQRPRCWLYLRVSSDPTARGLSVASQEAELRAWAQREDWQVVGVTTDNDMSASRTAKTRPGYKEVQAAMAAGRMDILACWESSRAHRDLRAYVDVRDLCVARDVLWAYKGRVYDLSRTDDRFSTGLDALLDERYADEVRDRVNRGVKWSVSQGRPRGKIPFGYRRLYNLGTGALESQEEDPVSGPIVREMFRRLAAEESVYAIAADFNRRNLPTPQSFRDARRGVTDIKRGAWTGSKIRRQADSSTVAGFLVHQGVVQGQGNWPALISYETYLKARRYLRNPDRRRQNGVTARYLLSGLLVCGVCGAKCRRVVNRGHESYTCQGKDYTNPSCVSIRRAPVDAVVTDAVLAFLSRTELADIFTPEDAPELDRAQQELRDLETELETWTQAAQEGRITLQMAEATTARLLPQIEAARERATPQWVPAEVRALAGRPDVADLWALLPLESQRSVLHAVVRVVLDKDPRPSGSRGVDLSRLRFEWR